MASGRWSWLGRDERGNVREWDSVEMAAKMGGVAGGAGPAGPVGPAGPQGERGPQGAVGSVGPAGDPGPQGVQGVPGPQGPKGDAGNDGAAGAEGPRGLQGVIGPAGPQGDAGTPGLAGPAGPKGDAGLPGAAGADGAAGAAGAQGPKGDKGDTGSAGQQGIQGPAGANATFPQFPVGYVMLQVVATNPATWLGYGTWTQTAQGLLLIGQTGGQTGAQQVGSATHGHAFTQPAAHTDHAALAHSAHAGITVANHTDVTNHVHVQQLQGGTTGTTTGTHLMGSAATGGNLRSSAQSTLNPTSVGTAAMAHTIGQGNVHTDHPAQSHSAHAAGAVTDGTVAPPSFVTYVFQRTA